MIVLAITFVLSLATAYQLGYLPLSLLIGYGGMSMLTFILYGVDKYAAIKDAQRIPEMNLLLCGLLGGWPGALLAQSLFRHKLRKAVFQLKFWLTSTINLTLLAGWLVAH